MLTLVSALRTGERISSASPSKCVYLQACVRVCAVYAAFRERDLRQTFRSLSVTWLCLVKGVCTSWSSSIGITRGSNAANGVLVTGMLIIGSEPLGEVSCLQKEWNGETK